MSTFLWIVGGLAVFLYLRREWKAGRARQAEAKHAAFLERIAAAQEWVNSVEVLPAITDLPIMLQSNEVCFFVADAEWWETRSKTTRVRMSGSSVSIPIAKGVRYRIAEFTPKYEREENLTLIDTGALYLTNKRIFFDGQKKNTSVRWSAVVKVAGFDGGFEVEKGSGKPITLQIAQDGERALAVAQYCLVTSR